MAEILQFDQFARLPERYRERARQIAQRVAEIDALCRPCEPRAIGDAVLRMFRQFREQPGADYAELGNEYRGACRDLPEWAVSEAANDFLAGRVENHTGQYMPTCAEFARRAREIIVPFLAERSALRSEADKLVERAEDEARRNFIAIERANPVVKARVAKLHEQIVTGMPKRVALQGHSMTPERQAAIDALKKPREFVSRIAETKLGKGDDPPPS